MAQVYIDFEANNGTSQFSDSLNHGIPRDKEANSITQLNDAAWERTLNHGLQILTENK